jgi:starch synthase
VVRMTSGAPTDERRARFDPDNPVIVFAGRAETVRGLDTLLAAFPLVQRKVPTARLRLLLIPRPELPAILERAGAAGRGGIAGIDVVTEPIQDLLAELSAAQVGTWPFKFDYTTSPPAMAVAEAMSVGLPVVATEVACVRAVVEPRVNGLLVPPANPRALASALALLLRDEEVWHRYAQAGVQSVRDRFGWERVASATDKAYAAALTP